MGFELSSPGSIYISREFQDLDAATRERVRLVTVAFEKVFSERVASRGLPALVARPKLPCNIYYFLDRKHLWMVGEVAHGLPMDRTQLLLDRELTEEIIERAALRELGYRDAFFVKLPRWLEDEDLESEKAQSALVGAADALLAREYQRSVAEAYAMRLEPIWGGPPIQVDPNLCFVIAPFSEDRTTVYRNHIKPRVEAHNLVCRRADDLRTNRAIMENVWRSICEAFFIIADLTHSNANVFYELGIAHTVGKPVIMIEERPQDGERPKRPFDTMGIDAVLYENSLKGALFLAEELDKRIDHLTARQLPPLPDIERFRL
jgi:hypothetical protein